MSRRDEVVTVGGSCGLRERGRVFIVRGDDYGAIGGSGNGKIKGGVKSIMDGLFSIGVGFLETINDGLFFFWMRLFVILKIPIAFRKSMVIAVEQRNVGEVRLLLGKYPALAYMRDNCGSIVLHKMSGGKLAVRLIRDKVNVNAFNDKGETLLHIATQNCYCNVDQIVPLIMCGADVNARDKKETTPIFYINGLHWDSTTPGKNVNALVENGADVNARDNMGRTPLHWADTASAVEALVKHGADVNARDSGGWTPLYSAVLGTRTTVVRALIRYGADINALDNHGRTPLDLAEICVLDIRYQGGKFGRELRGEAG